MLPILLAMSNLCAPPPSSWRGRMLLVAVTMLLLPSYNDGGRDSSSSDEEDPFAGDLIVPADGVKGNFGDENNGTQWTEADYLIFDQFNPNSEGIFNAYRLNFQCASETSSWDCNGASLLICYPSVLKNMLGESGERPPFFRELPSVSITNDKENEITKSCSQLMEPCIAHEGCRHTLPPSVQQKDGFKEVWHGFLIKRVDGRFVVELPFGNNATSVEISGSKSKQGEIPWSNIDLGKKENFTNTHLVPNADPIEPSAANGAAKVNDKCFNKHVDEDGWIGGEIRKHLFILSTDILPTEHSQKVRFYTQTFPNKVGTKVCEKNVDDTGLKLNDKSLIEYIVAKFMKPATPYHLPQSMVRPTSGKKGNSGGDKRGAPKTIDPETFKPIKGNKQTLPLKNTFYDIEFFVRGKVPAKAGQFSISVFQGPNIIEGHNVRNFTGQTLIEITVSFSDAQFILTECSVLFVPDNSSSPCLTNAEGMGLRRGQPFWMWIKIRHGQVDIDINCVKLPFNWTQPEYSQKSYITFEGDIELLTPALGSVLNINPKEKLPTGQRMLNILKLAGEGLQANHIFTMKGSLLPPATLNNVTIELLSSGGEKLVTMKMSFEEKCAVDVEESKCDVGNIPVCVHLTWKENTAKQGSLKMCSNFTFIIYQANNRERKVYFDGIERVIVTKDVTINAVFAQIRGDISTVEDDDVSIFTANSKREFWPMKLYDKHFLIISFMWLMEKQGDDSPLILKFQCHKSLCDDAGQTVEYSDSFILTIDPGKRAVQAKTFETLNDKLQLYKTADESNFNYVIASPRWVKIAVDKSAEKYQIYLEGEKSMEIEFKMRNPTTNALASVDMVYKFVAEASNIQLLNQPVVMPYFKQLQPGVKGGIVKESQTVTFVFRMLSNADIMEFMLINRGNIAGTNITKFFTRTAEDRNDIKNASGKVILHMQAVDITTGNKKKICSQANAFVPKGKLAVCDLDAEETASIANARKGYRLTTSFRFHQKSIDLLVNTMPPINYEVQDALTTTDIMINGDIALEILPELKNCCVNYPEEQYCHQLPCCEKGVC